jgi:hypothetical protein
MFLGPTVAIDRNHDVWLAWVPSYSGTSLWTHSYVTATAEAPRVVPAGPALRIEWDLSESAADSWWAVLRDPGTGAFEEVARVRANQGTGLSWLDESPPAPGSNPVRYRIRRESVDARFAWESAATSWGTASVPVAGPSARQLRLSAGRNPIGARTTIDLLGADPGPVDILVYDVGGRLVSETRASAESDEVRSIPLDLGRQSHGIYLVIARDARGRTSPGLKLVRLDD